MKSTLVTIVIIFSTGFGFGQVTQKYSQNDSILTTTQFNSIGDSTGILKSDRSKHDYGAFKQTVEGEGTNEPLLNGYEERTINGRIVYIKQNDTIRSVYEPKN